MGRSHAPRHDLAEIEHHLQCGASKPEERPEMSKKTVVEAERERTRRQYAELSSHYRSIGPAAILAALMFATKRTTKNTVVYGGKPA